ncbi:MAG: putative Ig domain-containing protein [Candidatus Thermoplasmatota archaeon]|nr:putative Ig domain-containing protein [Candidatus Thermoplasmatota archaeon]
MEDPYLIMNATHLQMISEDLDGHYALANDIEAAETVAWRSGKGFRPIGSSTDPFEGSLNGRNHTVYGLYINDSSIVNVGMFAYVDDSGRVSNLRMEVSYVEGENTAGGLTGTNRGTLVNVHFIGDVKGRTRCGGLVGLNTGSMKGCSAMGTVDGSGGSSIGGLIGEGSGGIIEGSYSRSDVRSAGDHVGGLIGKLTSGQVMLCSSSGKAEGGTFTGGLIGYSYSSQVRKSYSTSEVYSTKTDIGGLIGFSSSSVFDCYASGNVTGTYLVGGLVGTSSTVTRCYSVGKVTGGSHTGGLIGSGGGAPYSFFDNETSGWTTSASGAGRSTYLMKSSATFASSTWDMVDTWNIIEGESYPFLRETEHAPVFTIGRIPPAFEDEPYSFDLSPHVRIFDTPGMIDNFTMSMDPGIDWISISPGGSLSAIPENEQVGSFHININAQDSGGRVTTKTFVLEVVNVNDPPVITTVPVTSVLQDEEYSLHLEAYDIDPTGDVLAFSVSTDADWLSMEGNYLNGTPSNEDVGSYWVNITVEDGNGGWDNLNFTLDVLNVNDPPVITTIPITSVLQDEMYSLHLEAYDMDPTGDILSFSVSTDAGWLSLEGDYLNGTPTNDDVGIFCVNVTVEDGNEGYDHLNFTLEAMNVNDPPVITTTPITSVSQDERYSLRLEAYDIDPVETVLTWELVTDAEWLSLEDDLVSGVPTNDDVGRYDLRITVRDGEGGFDIIEFRLDVIDVNDPPYWLTVPANATVREGQDYMAECLALDVDPGDVITYSISSTPSSGITVMSVSGIIRYQDPAPGTYIVDLTATDGESVIWHKFTLDVEAEDGEAQDPETWDRGIILIACSSLTVSVFLIAVVGFLLFLILKSRRKGSKDEE